MIFPAPVPTQVGKGRKDWSIPSTKMRARTAVVGGEGGRERGR